MGKMELRTVIEYLCLRREVFGPSVFEPGEILRFAFSIEKKGKGKITGKLETIQLAGQGWQDSHCLHSFTSKPSGNAAQSEVVNAAFCFHEIVDQVQSPLRYAPSEMVGERYAERGLETIIQNQHHFLLPEGFWFIGIRTPDVLDNPVSMRLPVPCQTELIFQLKEPFIYLPSEEIRREKVSIGRFSLSRLEGKERAVRCLLPEKPCPSSFEKAKNPYTINPANLSPPSADEANSKLRRKHFIRNTLSEIEIFEGVQFRDGVLVNHPLLMYDRFLQLTSGPGSRTIAFREYLQHISGADIFFDLGEDSEEPQEAADKIERRNIQIGAYTEKRKYCDWTLEKKLYREYAKTFPDKERVLGLIPRQAICRYIEKDLLIDGKTKRFELCLNTFEKMLL